MLKVGLTGGIACGKSSVGKMFAKLGAHVIDADKIAHELMRPGETVYEEIVRSFGRDILAPDGTIDRTKLAAKAFEPEELPKGSPRTNTAVRSRIEQLNSIVHPAVIRRQERWIEEVVQKNPNAVAIVEAALIFEAGLANRFHRVVVVSCGAEAKVERFSGRSKMPIEAARSEVERRSRAQLSDEEKIRRADYVIDNSGTPERTESQVQQVWKELAAEALRRR